MPCWTLAHSHWHLGSLANISLMSFNFTNTASMTLEYLLSELMNDSHLIKIRFLFFNWPALFKLVFCTDRSNDMSSKWPPSGVPPPHTTLQSSLYLPFGARITISDYICSRVFLFFKCLSPWLDLSSVREGPGFFHSALCSR